MNIAVLRLAPLRLVALSADEEVRLLAEAREKARRDEESRLRGAREEGRHEAQLDFARNALQRELPIEEIAALTRLSLEEIRGLH
jgi:predicted transposase/invertase (TIGR01784 family)